MRSSTWTAGISPTLERRRSRVRCRGEHGGGSIGSLDGDGGIDLAGGMLASKGAVFVGRSGWTRGCVATAQARCLTAAANPAKERRTRLGSRRTSRGDGGLHSGDEGGGRQQSGEAMALLGRVYCILFMLTYVSCPVVWTQGMICGWCSDTGYLYSEMDWNGCSGHGHSDTVVMVVENGGCGEGDVDGFGKSGRHGEDDGGLATGRSRGDVVLVAAVR
ncbi:proline-rich receptor-like protein kinase PERK9 [Iris pallida]|uniref:Proline-rich receptor-like protein kinase PERK9 n=1 Tax=Iris pallida TaxID=29817 RepID=A0AAX6I3G2_IRIPA|nr:proline-rich receptor-like protein kinase PERK9 [Iris pallida]